MTSPCVNVGWLVSLTLGGEAQGAWWFSRASNPLRVAERRPGWVRFPHASAKTPRARREKNQMKQTSAWLAVVLLSLSNAVSTEAQENFGISAKTLPWQEFRAPDKSFKLMLPVKPTKQRIPGMSKSSGIDMASYKASLGTLEFLLMYMTLPYAAEDPNTSKRLLDGGRALALADPKAQVLSESEMWLDDHPGRELVVKFPTTIMRARIFLIDRRMYTLGVILPYDESNQKIIQDTVELVANRYFASFTKLGPKK